MSQDNMNDDDDFDFDGDEDLEFDDGSAAAQKASGGGNNTVVRIAIIAGAFIALFAGIAMFSGGEEPLQSSTPAAPETTEAPGGDVTPEIRKAIEVTNQQVRETAEATGGSAIPVPVGPARSTEAVQNEEFDNSDPLARWREIQQQRLAQQNLQRQEQRVSLQNLQQQQANQQQQQQDRDRAVNDLATAMQAQMQQVLGEYVPPSIQVTNITNGEAYLANIRQQQQQQIQVQQQQQIQIQQQQAAQIQPEIIIPAGKIEYGQMILEANTDAPGPVLAQIASGPLRGSRLIGNFQTQRNFLTLQFSQVIVNDQSVAIQAIAINPETSTPGIVTEIDRRYFSRVVLPTAASFVEGFGQAVAESGTTTVTVDGGAAVESQNDLDTREELFAAAANAGAELGDLIDEEASQIEPLLRIEPGTPIALLFLSPVIDPETAPANNAAGLFSSGGLPAGLDPAILQNPAALQALGIDPTTLGAQAAGQAGANAGLGQPIGVNQFGQPIFNQQGANAATPNTNPFLNPQNFTGQ